MGYGWDGREKLVPKFKNILHYGDASMGHCTVPYIFRKLFLTSNISFATLCLYLQRLTRSSAVAKRPHDASCLYSFNTKRQAQSFIISRFGFRYHCVQLNSFLFSSLRRIRPCCRPSRTNIRWCVADCAIYTAWSSVTVFVTS